jgi:hypothetical protein
LGVLVMSAREPFQSLLSDIREATQTLANCAAKGALKPDGTRAMPVKYVRNIHLTFEQPPIPLRDWDWRAMHDGDDEEPSRHGWGRTPEAALADLKQRDEDWEDSLQTESERLLEEYP